MLDDRSASGSFPVIRSLLVPAALAQTVGAAYGLTHVRCRLIKATSRDVYHVDSQQGASVLIVYRHGRRTAAEITAELDLLDHLDAQGLAVAPAIRTLTGESLVPLAAPEGARYAVLFRFVQGVPMSRSPSTDIVRRLGRLVAGMHAATDSWHVGTGCINARPALDASLLIDRSLARIEALAPVQANDLADLQQVADALRQYLLSLPRATPGYGLIHGDIIPNNVLIGSGGELTLLDFDFCGPGWRSFDLATYLWDSQSRHATASAAGVFLASYQEVRPLADWELAAIPWFVAVRSLFRLGNQAARVEEWGSSSLPDDLLAQQVAAIFSAAADLV